MRKLLNLFRRIARHIWNPPRACRRKDLAPDKGNRKERVDYKICLCLSREYRFVPQKRFLALSSGQHGFISLASLGSKERHYSKNMNTFQTRWGINPLRSISLTNLYLFALLIELAPLEKRT